MTSGYSVHEVLMRERASDILIELLYSDELTVSELLKRIGGSASTIMRRLRELLEVGLISEESTRVWPYKRLIRLTEHGKRIAKMIRAMRLSEISVLNRSPARWIILLSYLTGGKFESRTRLVKFLFILKNEYGVQIDYDFIWYKHGPFTKEILIDLDALELFGLIKVHEEFLDYDKKTGEPIVRYTIILTDHGKKVAEDLLFKTPQGIVDILKELIKKYYNMPLRDLLDYIYSKYANKKTQSF